MTYKHYMGAALGGILLFNLAGCQKSDKDDHVFKSQENALKKAQAVQKLVTDRIVLERKRIQDATE